MWLWTASNDVAAEPQDKFVSGDSFEVDVAPEGVHELIATLDSDYTTFGPRVSLIYGIKDGSVAYDAYSLFGAVSTSLSITTDITEGSDKGLCEPIVIVDGQKQDMGRACTEEANLVLTLCNDEAEAS